MKKIIRNIQQKTAQKIEKNQFCLGGEIDCLMQFFNKRLCRNIQYFPFRIFKWTSCFKPDVKVGNLFSEYAGVNCVGRNQNDVVRS